jgi:hypothetical protein
MPSSANDVKLEDGIASEGTAEGQTSVTAQNSLEEVVPDGFAASSTVDDERSRINGASASSHMHFTPPASSSPPPFSSAPFGPSGPPPTSSTSTLQPTASVYNPYGAPPQSAYTSVPQAPFAPAYSYLPVSMANGAMQSQTAMHGMWVSSSPPTMTNGPYVGRQPPLMTTSTPAHLQSGMFYTPGSSQYGVTVPLPANGGGYKPGRAGPPGSTSRAPGAGRGDFSRSPSMLHNQGPIYSAVGVPFDSSYSGYPAPPYRPSPHSPSLSFSPNTATHLPLPPPGASTAMQPIQPYVPPYTAVSAPGNASTFSGGSGNMGFGVAPLPPSALTPRAPPGLANTFNANSGYGSSSASKRW